MKNKLGLITYHAAYNFGSVLQSYATQVTLERLGYPNEIIDYRTKSQTFWYHTDFTFKFGLLGPLKMLGFNFIRKKRCERIAKFNDFINNYLKLSACSYTNYAQFRDAETDYDILVSGSDQIWNIDCGEFAFELQESILPYFLAFSSARKRVAYASSIGHKHLNYVKKFQPHLSKFDALSTREPGGARILRKALGREVEVVADPTWLLDKAAWQIKGTYKPDVPKKYILWYTLNTGPRAAKSWANSIRLLASRFDFDVYWMSPFTYVELAGINRLDNAGPLDFLSYMSNASLVITDTFHGTIFPANFGVPFYSCKVFEGSRQSQILSLCDLEERIVQSPGELVDVKDYSCDFSQSARIITSLRESSIAYLKKSLDETDCK